jgi:mRNA interferase HicA
MLANSSGGWRGMPVVLRAIRGGSGHLTVIRGDRRSQLPMHGSNRELGSGLVRKIKKDLGLD